MTRRFEAHSKSAHKEKKHGSHAQSCCVSYPPLHANPKPAISSFFQIPAFTVLSSVLAKLRKTHQNHITLQRGDPDKFWFQSQFIIITKQKEKLREQWMSLTPRVWAPEIAEPTLSETFRSFPTKPSALFWNTSLLVTLLDSLASAGFFLLSFLYCFFNYHNCNFNSQWSLTRHWHISSVS